MTVIRITCPTTWYKRCNWIEENCKNYADMTCWAGWQIGYNDIEFIVDEEDAILYKLVWG